MKAKKIIGVILKLPLALIVLGSFGAAIYAAYAHIQNITWAASIVIGAAIILYIVGIILMKEKKEIKNDQV